MTRVEHPINAGWCVVTDAPPTPYDDVMHSNIGLVVREFRGPFGWVQAQTYRLWRQGR